MIEKEAEVYASIDDIELAVDRYQELLQLNQATFSVHSLEQFCNLRAKLLVKNQIRNTGSIKKLLDNLKTLLLIGETPERLNILGSAHKRIAQLTTGEQREQHLKSMADYYHQAFELLQPNISDAIYPLTNWLTSQALSVGNRKILIDGNSLSPMTHLIKFQKIIELKTAEYKDFWNDISLVNILICKMLFSRHTADINNLKENIINIYNNAWNIGGSYKHVRTEIEHIEFIQAIWKDDKSRDRKKILIALQEVKENLEGLMK